VAQDQDLDVLAAVLRVSNPSQPNTVTEIRYSSRNSTAHDHGLTMGVKETAGHRIGDEFWHGTGSRIRTLEGISRRIYSQRHTSADDRVQVPDRGRLEAASASQKILSIRRTAPSPGRQASGMAGHRIAAVARVWHPADLPRGYHTVRYQSLSGRYSSFS